MTIFSTFTRTDASPASHGESHADFLDRVAGSYWDQVRDLVEDWFARLSPDARADVRGRLQSRDDRQSRGAFFELYLHECLLRMGYAVTCHPELDGTSRRPDFLAEKDGRSFYIEARSASSSDVAVGNSARVNAVYESPRQDGLPILLPLDRRCETWRRTTSCKAAARPRRKVAWRVGSG